MSRTEGRDRDRKGTPSAQTVTENRRRTQVSPGREEPRRRQRRAVRGADSSRLTRRKSRWLQTSQQRRPGAASSVPKENKLQRGTFTSDEQPVRARTVLFHGLFFCDATGSFALGQQEREPGNKKQASPRHWVPGAAVLRARPEHVARSSYESETQLRQSGRRLGSTCRGERRVSGHDDVHMECSRQNDDIIVT